MDYRKYKKDELVTLCEAYKHKIDYLDSLKNTNKDDSTINIDLKTKNNKSLFVTAGVTSFIWIVLVLLLRYIINTNY